ncbi:MAG: glycosyltransferase family 4 protein [Candidatus Curtissbacteria bacterium]|nr:glycosyltransferase family 4 protein [Candidatus Curtissbacteria bacterium]
MKNIAILSFYSGVVERGVETFTLEISKRLAKNYNVTIFTAGPVLQQKFKVKEIKAFAKPPKSSKGILGKFYLDWQSLKILLFTLRVLPVIFKNKYQVIIPLNGGWQIAVLRTFSKLSGSKILVSGHAGIGSDDAWNLFFRPEVFVALTKTQSGWAKKLVPEVKTVVIPNGVDLSRFNPKVKPQDVSLPKPIIICASALVPYKRIDLTIKAVAKTKNLSLLVLGDGEEKGAIDTLGKRLLGKRYLRICAPYEKMPGYYRAGKVFSLASKTEAFGIAYVEAMACNLPVVTTNDSSRAEIIGDVGILTNPSDSTQYAKDLEITAKANYGNKPYAQALNFSWNNVAKKYADLIEKMLTK